MKTILFGNQKGGVGKTSIILLLADYIKRTKLENVAVLDLDIQQSIMVFSKTDEEPRYPVYQFHTIEEIDAYLGIIEEYDKKNGTETINFIDLQGGADQLSILLYDRADYIIVPYDYGDTALNSTLVYIDLLLYFKVDMKKVITLGNCIQATTKKDKLEAYRKEISKKSNDIHNIEDFIRQNVVVSNIKSLYVEYKEEKGEIKYLFEDFLENLYKIIKQ